MPELSDSALVETVRERAANVVRFRMDLQHGNNPSVLVDQAVPVSLCTTEIGNRDRVALRALLHKIVGDTTEVDGHAFTVMSATPGSVCSGSIMVTFTHSFVSKAR